MKFVAREMLRVGFLALIGTWFGVGIASAEDHTWKRQPGHSYVWGGAHYCSWTSTSAAHSWGPLPSHHDSANRHVWRQGKLRHQNLWVLSDGYPRKTITTSFF